MQTYCVTRASREATMKVTTQKSKATHNSISALAAGFTECAEVDRTQQITPMILKDVQNASTKEGHVQGVFQGWSGIGAVWRKKRSRAHAFRAAKRVGYN